MQDGSEQGNERHDEKGQYEAPDLTGDYGFVAKSSSGEGDNLLEITVHGLAKIASEDSSIGIGLSACKVVVNNGGDISTDRDLVKYSLDSFGELTALQAEFVQGESGLEIKVKDSAFVVGAKLEDPRRDSLVGNDYDQDGDGHPGVTVPVAFASKIDMAARFLFSSELTLGELGENGWTLNGVITLGEVDALVYEEHVFGYDVEDIQEKLDEEIGAVQIAGQQQGFSIVPGYSDCKSVVSEL
jgi:hypothetical protein